MIKKFFISSLLTLVFISNYHFSTCRAQTDTTTRNRTLEEVSIQQRKVEGVSRMGGALNGSEIGQGELFRAACCNLGESFVTNPSVDVNYNDAEIGRAHV